MQKLRDWENIYKDKGVVQHEVLHTVSHSIMTLRENNCRVVLDLGCGTGRHSIFLAKHKFDVHAIDISPTAIKIASERATNEGLFNIKFKLSDIMDIQYDDNFFDAIICVWSTGHGLKEDIRKSVQEMYRILKPDGILLVDFMSTEDRNYGKGVSLEENTFLHDFIDHPDVPHHYSTYEEIQDFLSFF